MWSYHHGNKCITAVCLVLLCGAKAVPDNGFETTFCIGELIVNAAQCFGSDTVIQVNDIEVYHDEDSHNQVHRVCLHDTEDPGEPLLRLSPVEFDDIVTQCDGKQVCDVDVKPLTFANKQKWDYIRMSYTCVNDSPIKMIDIHDGGDLAQRTCPEYSSIHIMRALFSFPDNECEEQYSHVRISEFSVIKTKCRHTKCDSAIFGQVSKNCSNVDVPSTGIRIYYRCNKDPTTATLKTTHGLTSTLYTSQLEQTTEGGSAQTNKAVTTSTKLGLYAGLPLACVLVIVVIGIILTRSRSSRLIPRMRLRKAAATRHSSTNTRVSTDDDEQQDRTGFSHSPGGEEYCEVGPAVTTQCRLNPDPTLHTTSHDVSRGDIASAVVYSMVQPSSKNYDSEELEIIDNSQYEATPVRNGSWGINNVGPNAVLGAENNLTGGAVLAPFASRQRISDGVDDEDILVDNSNYSTWGN